jgi:hypothetical protein
VRIRYLPGSPGHWYKWCTTKTPAQERASATIELRGNVQAHPVVSNSDPRPSSIDGVGLVDLIAELVHAGLVSTDLDDEGSVGYVLTDAGVRTAQQMAMHKQGHALVLLGALAGSEIGPN